MNSSITRVSTLLLLFTIILVGCKDSTSSGPEESIESDSIANIPAEVQSIVSTSGPFANIPGDTADTGAYTFFDLDTGEIVEDSTSSQWDIGFSRTDIIANTGNNGGIQVVEQNYDEALSAPTENYVASTSESSASWYNYNAAQFLIEVLDDRTIFVLTPEGNYAKVEIAGYYFDQNSSNDARYFTFYYTLQTDGTTSLSNIVYYDLDAMEVVSNASSPQWDVAFGATTVYANSNNDGGILPLNTPFSDVNEAPESGYQAQNSSWYTYTGNGNPPMAILPKEDLTLVVVTPEGNYAKIKVLSYYEDNPDVNSPEFVDIRTRPAARYYTFDYVLQTNGTRFFE